MGNCYVSSLLSLWANDRSVIEQLTEEEIIETINNTDIELVAEFSKSIPENNSLHICIIYI